MSKLRRALLFVYAGFIVSSVFAESLEQTVSEALKKQPEMKESISLYHASRSDVKIAWSKFSPSVDIIADVGKENVDASRLDTPGSDETLARRSAALQVSVPLFRGFANVKEKNRAELERDANYYQSLAKAEMLSLQISKAYLDVLSAKEVVVMSLENLDHHSKTYELVNKRHSQGVIDKSDLSQVRGRMARARANLTAAKNNLRDVDTVLEQLVYTPPKELIRPRINTDYLPESNERALELAYANNQSLLASKKASDAANATVGVRKAHYYPKLDFVANKTWKSNVSGAEGSQDEWQMLVKLNWNLFSGGGQSAEHSKAVYLQHAAGMRSNTVLREVKANVDSSWRSYKSLEEELVYLQEYVTQSKLTQKLYSEQFNVGLRTLLDLLDSQNELFQARRSYVAASYNYMYSKYRIITSMSYILDALNVNIMKGIQNEG